jgi:hypothetical protein
VGALARGVTLPAAAYKFDRKVALPNSSQILLFLS